jgi:adenylate cyclase, class 2
LGVVSSHKEINLKILDKNAMSDLFIELGMEIYAHQEKDRVSWVYKEWQFDLDQYPNMPAYLEIEGKSEGSIQEAIKLLGLENKIATPKGERIVITENYGLDWYNMNF